jgi:hypothetical protein
MQSDVDDEILILETIEVPTAGWGKNSGCIPGSFWSISIFWFYSKRIGNQMQTKVQGNIGAARKIPTSTFWA